ncbi:MAG: helix-turn-helix domain-containing protein [Phenylobacterium sp.]|nr:helix-turn-helix domain-containing protein [Phenylobacterium sp.]
MVPRLLKTVEAAAFLGVSPRTLEDWRLRGGGPRFRKMRRAVRYHPADLISFADQDIRENTGARALAA